jgi:hypothetical protein
MDYVGLVVVSYVLGWLTAYWLDSFVTRNTEVRQYPIIKTPFIGECNSCNATDISVHPVDLYGFESNMCDTCLTTIIFKR